MRRTESNVDTGGQVDCGVEQTFVWTTHDNGSMVNTYKSKTAPESVARTADWNPGPNRPHLSERGSAVSIMLPPDSEKANWSARGWRANDLTPEDVEPLLDRFRTGFEPGDPAECWIWTGYRINLYGGVYRPKGKPALLAHRVAWVASTGQALTGQLTIDHLCNVPLCVNPAHLEPVTLAENQRRKRERNGWGTTAERASKVSCETCGTVTRKDKMRRHQRNMHGVSA